MAAGVAFALGVPLLLGLVQSLGYRIPLEDLSLDIALDYTKGLALAIGLGACLFALPLPREERNALAMAWLLRCLLTLGLMLLYEWNYGLDAYWYFQQARSSEPDLRNIGFGLIGTWRVLGHKPASVLRNL